MGPTTVALLVAHLLWPSLGVPGLAENGRRNPGPPPGQIPPGQQPQPPVPHTQHAQQPPTAAGVFPGNQIPQAPWTPPYATTLGPQYGHQALAPTSFSWQSTHAAPNGGYITSCGGYAFAQGASVQVDSYGSPQIFMPTQHTNCSSSRRRNNKVRR